MRVRDLAAFLESPWEGDGERELGRAASREDAGPEDLSFVSRGRALKQAGASRAACLLVPPDFPNDAQRTLIRTRNPRAAMARAISRLNNYAAPALS